MSEPNKLKGKLKDKIEKLENYIDLADAEYLLFWIHTFFNNSVRLCCDSYILFQNKSYPSACMQAVYAIEEFARGRIFAIECLNRRMKANIPHDITGINPLSLIFENHGEKHKATIVNIGKQILHSNPQGTVSQSAYDDLEIIANQCATLRLPYIEILEETSFPIEKPWQKFKVFIPWYSINQDNVENLLCCASVYLYKYLNVNKEPITRLSLKEQKEYIKKFEILMDILKPITEDLNSRTVTRQQSK